MSLLEQCLLKLLLSSDIWKYFWVIVLGQYSHSVVVHYHQALHGVEGGLQQHILQRHLTLFGIYICKYH